MAEEFEGQSHSAVANMRAREDLNNTITEIEGIAPEISNIAQKIDINLEKQVNLDEIHEYNQNSRKAFNKRFTTIENKIKEQDEKLDRILSLLEDKK